MNVLHENEDLSAMNESVANSIIDTYRLQLLQSVNTICTEVRNKRKSRGYNSTQSFSEQIFSYVVNAIKASSPLFPIDAFEMEFIERWSFQADIAFKSTSLLSTDKSAYFKDYCPKLISLLKEITIQGIPLFQDVKSVGIYVNAKLPASKLFESLDQILLLGDQYGESSVGQGQDIAIDYSSPNAAKHLHAGHIRSTIIGHVLGSMYEACGYTVHRINYLNDWGGMGVLIEWLSSRTNIESYTNKNDLLFEIYSNFRKAQKAADWEGIFKEYTPSEKDSLATLVGDFTDYESFLRQYHSFSLRAIDQFSALEGWQDATFATWRKIVEWSLQDFERFYKILDIHQEYLTGEGLYAQLWKEMVMREVENGNILYFDGTHADTAIKLIEKQLEEWVITTDAFDRKKQEIQDDIWCYVVPIGDDERYVVLKKDGATIYATRDLAALEHRMKTFSPKKLIYEVGQEQQEHFDKLFRAARKLNIVGDSTELLHVYHGFYVDETTKKKLSSRDGAANIMKLLTDTIEYFHAKYDGEDFTDAEKKHISKTLGVGSIIYNDIKKDKKSSVAISSEFNKMMLQFEESGGAYLIYTSCRAKSILRKYAKPLPNINSIKILELKDSEADLVKKILSFPDVVRKASHAEDPVRIAEYITSIASQFNSYYHSTPILKWEQVEQWIIISYCVSQVIDNGLRILHIGSLERI